MEEPRQTDAPLPESVDLYKFNKAAAKTTLSVLNAGAGFFKKAKAAFQGDNNARDELADAAASAWVKTGDTVIQLAEKTGQKIAEKVDSLENKRKPPKP